MVYIDMENKVSLNSLYQMYRKWMTTEIKKPLEIVDLEYYSNIFNRCYNIGIKCPKKRHM